MLYADRLAEDSTPATDTLTLPFEKRCRRRQHHLRLPGGEELGYHLPPGACLRDGDKLLARDGATERVVAIAAARESLVEVRAADSLRFARAAFHLGNRHVAAELGADAQGLFLRLQPDHVLTSMLLGLGCTVEALMAPFEPEGGAYAGHGHDLGADHGHDHGPKIHEFR